jgi:hypothetical protein
MVGRVAIAAKPFLVLLIGQMSWVWSGRATISLVALHQWSLLFMFVLLLATVCWGRATHPLKDTGLPPCQPKSIVVWKGETNL